MSFIRTNTASFSGPYFPAFGLNTGRYSLSPYLVQMREIQTRKSPITDTFYTVKSNDKNSSTNFLAGLCP